VQLSRFIARFTVRRLMVAVTIMGIVLGVTIKRHNQFRKIASHHQAEVETLVSRIDTAGYGALSDQPLISRAEWHELMRHRYERAARCPWLPAPPDAPEPQ
jgi:hypothetical protein